MVGINAVQVDAAGGRRAAPSLTVNSVGRKLQLQARNGGCSGRIRIGLSGGWNVSVRNLRICKIQGLEYQGYSVRGRANGLRIKRNEVEYWNGTQRSSRKVIRAEARSRQPGSFEFPRAWRFWEAGPQSKTEASAASAQPAVELEKDHPDFETELFFKDHSVDARTAKGDLSPAAINTIEQFSRLNGLTGKKMRANFEATAPIAVQNEAQNLVEFCIFRYFSRPGADFHPSLWDASFRQLTFTAMLAWQRPYLEDIYSSEETKLPRKGVVGVKAFNRIASAIPGAADRVTAQFLFEALTAEDGQGLTFEVWDTYIKEVCKLHEERKQYKMTEGSTLGLESDETVISVGNNKRQPVQKWNGGLVWPGRLTLTDRAVYFEANSLTSHQAPIRLDITRKDTAVRKKRVGPFGAEVFDSAISIGPRPDTEAWVLEFVDFGGEQRRNTWFAIVNELITMYWFIGEYGPKGDDPLLEYIDGAKQGRKRATSGAINSIARLQAVQYILRSTLEHPERLLHFSSVRDAPSEELVYEALAVTYWAGRMDSKAKELDFSVVGGGQDGHAEDTLLGTGQNTMGDDGRSVYLRRWMTSTSWSSTKSMNFWKSYRGMTTRGLVLGKNFVVGGLTHLDRAVRACREQSKVADKTRATIDGAKLTGIPLNVDLLQELLLPFSIIGVNFQKLKRWEEPGASAGFLLVATGIIYMKWLSYVFPTLALSCAGTLFTLRGLKARGKLGSDFGKVTVRDQPPTNTIQKIMALKEALTALENFLVTVNIALLKLRTVALSRHLHSTNEVLLTLIVAGVTTWFIPFRYLFLAFLIDQFTIELPFRRKGMEEVINRVQDWWSEIPATPVEVLPPDKKENVTDTHLPGESSEGPSQAEAVMQALSGWLGDDQ